LHPLDLQLYVDMTSLDVSDWSVLKVWYNSQIFNSTAAFRSAWESGTLQRSAKPDLKDVDWSTRKRKGSVRDLDDRAGPRQVSVS
jgi:primary-amine oxidase